MIGDQGSESPALYDHKAFLFDRSFNLRGIPVEIAKQQERTLKKGLVFRGGITHLQNGELPNWLKSGRFVTKALVIGKRPLHVSNDMVKMNNLADLSEL